MSHRSIMSLLTVFLLWNDLKSVNSPSSNQQKNRHWRFLQGPLKGGS